MGGGSHCAAVARAVPSSPPPRRRRAPARTSGGSCRGSASVWNETMSAPSIPSSTVVRHGSRENTSGGGKGTWRKKPIPPGAAGPPEQVGQQQEVVVVHPAEPGDGGIVGGGEALVDDAVRVPPGAVERRPLDEAVQERPERAVREAVVVVVDLAPRQRHRAKLDLEALDRASASRCHRPSRPRRRRATSSRAAARPRGRRRTAARRSANA